MTPFMDITKKRPFDWFSNYLSKEEISWPKIE